MAQRPLSMAMPQAPFVDPTTGDIALVWRMFLTQLWNRTGGAVGADSNNPTLAAQLAIETQQRQAGDTALTGAIGAETSRAETAEGDLAQQISVERQSRATDDMLGDASAQKLVNAERDARIAADALLVPIALLCSMWAACDLGFLPKSNPGDGRPWLNDGIVTVGLSGATDIGLESGGGFYWANEAGNGEWLWG